MLKAREFRPRPAVIEAKANKIIRKLRRYHRLGQLGDSAKPPSTVDLARKNGIGVNTAFKARAFARHYTRKELDALCRRRRPDGLPLNWAYVPYLLTVEDKQKRAEFERQAAKRGWTAPDLCAAIQSKRSKHRKAGGGRPPKQAKVAGTGLSRIVQESKTWLRYCEAIRPALVDFKFGRQPKRAYEEVEKAISELHKVVQSAEGLATCLAKQLATSKKNRPKRR